VADELRRKADACARVDAEFITRTRPGMTLGQIFQGGVDAYRDNGYAEDWKLHHQGGLAGYEPREVFGVPGSPVMVAGGRTGQDPAAPGDTGNLMKTARIHGPGNIQLHDEPIPTPQPDETLVRVTAVGLCGSDLHWFSEGGIGDTGLVHPLILGHEFAGVTPSGQCVALDPSVPCDRCEDCREGNPNLCGAQQFAGFAADDGGLREWVAWKTRCLVPIPETLSDADGAMLEPLGIALHAVDLGKLRAGMRVGVFGCGPIGLLVLQVARAAGAAEIFFTEPLEHRRDAARQFGACEWDGRQEVDVVFECAGVNQAVRDATLAIKPGGRVILVGIPEEAETCIPASVARRKGLTVKWSRRMKHTYPRALRLVESGPVNVRSLVTHCFPLKQVVEAFA
jgi:L-iditol 2-dehydrogenase